MALKRVAVVTGSNKGIGLSIVRGLCKEFDGDVFLTARDVGRGQAAVKDLEGEGLNAKFHQLDITDTESITRLRDFLKENYQGLDILVNNAGIALDADIVDILNQICAEDNKAVNPELFASHAEETIKVNFTSQINVCRILFPLLRPHARVVDISSGAGGRGFNNCSDAVKDRFMKPGLTMDELSVIMQEYVQACHEGKHLERGFYDNAYCMSKLAMNLMSSMHQKQLDDQGAEDIVVNSCSPGFVNTDMTRGKGTLTVEEGAATPLYLSLLPRNISSPRGAFVRNKQICQWWSEYKPAAK